IAEQFAKQPVTSSGIPGKSETWTKVVVFSVVERSRVIRFAAQVVNEKRFRSRSCDSRGSIAAAQIEDGLEIRFLILYGLKSVHLIRRGIDVPTNSVVQREIVASFPGIPGVELIFNVTPVTVPSGS